MKKSIFILLVIISIFVASCAPQVTAVTEATVTLPAATQTPEPSATPTAVYTPTPDKEILTTRSGIELELGAQVEGQEDAFVIMSMDKGKDWATLDGDTRLGFKPEDNQWVYIKGADGSARIVLQRVSDNTQVAELKASGTVSWSWSQLVDNEGESVFFIGAKLLEKKNILSALSSQLRIMSSALPDLPEGTRSQFLIVATPDGKKVVLVLFTQRGDNPQAGFVRMVGADNKPITLWTENFDLDLPSVTR